MHDTRTLPPFWSPFAKSKGTIFGATKKILSNIISVLNVMSYQIQHEI